MTESISSEDPPLNKVALLQRIIEQLNVDRLIYEEQAALYGPLNVPPYVKNAIDRISADLEDKQAELRQLRTGGGTALPQNSALRKFWEPFVLEGARFIVPYELPANVAKTKMKVLGLTMQGVFNLYRLLLEQFADAYDNSQIRLEVAGLIDRDTRLEGVTVSPYPHLIIYGGPGANPLANYLLSQFKGIAPYAEESIVRQGYIFRVSGDYLGSPFIISEAGLTRYSNQEQAAIQAVGIYDLKGNDEAPHCFPRTFERYEVPSQSDRDCALVVTGWASLPGENRIRRVVILGGHSRHSTLFSTAFVATNEEWAKQVNALPYYNTETVIGLQADLANDLAIPIMLAEPREIYKQSSWV